MDAERALLDADASGGERETVAVRQEASGCSPSIRRESNCRVCAQLEGIQEAKGLGRLDSHAAGDSYASRVSGVLVLFSDLRLPSQ